MRNSNINTNTLLFHPGVLNALRNTLPASQLATLRKSAPQLRNGISRNNATTKIKLNRSYEKRLKLVSNMLNMKKNQYRTNYKN